MNPTKATMTVTPTSNRPARELIGAWLGLAADTAWPPDHYTLLGLPPGEPDLARIEQQVQERLARARSYQLANPVAATEAMNLLARAFCCLTDAQAKLAYDARLGVPPAPTPAATPTVPPLRSSKPTPVPQSSLDTAVTNTVTQLDTPKPPSAAPPPEAVPVSVPVAVAVPVPVVAIPVPPAPLVPTPPAPPPPERRPVNPVIVLARRSRAARHGLGTRRGLFERILETRLLLRAWQRAGKFVSNPARRLTRAAEGVELTRRLVAVFEMLGTFPPIVGHPGQPGYRLVAVAEQEGSADVFKRLDGEERALLARDWEEGRGVLVEHLAFLREEVRRLRRCWCGERIFRPVQWWLEEHRGWVWLILGVITAVIVAFVVLR